MSRVREHEEAARSNDSAIDQRVSVSESAEGMIGGFKGERALRASAIMVDLRLAQSCIDRVAFKIVETKVEVYTERRGRKVPDGGGQNR